MKENANAIYTLIAKILVRLAACWLVYWLYNYRLADALNLPHFGFGIFVGLSYGLRNMFATLGNDNDKEGK